MRTIAHLSDLHFGRSDAAVADALSVHVRSLKPDVVVISGDLTQRAREREYQQAADFLRLLPSPQIIVPGNHDVPLHNVVARLRSPLDFYRRYISDDLAPYYRDEEIAVLGINTARSLTWKNGRISREQVIASCEQLERSTGDVVRMIVTHHPFDLPASYRPRHLVGRARMAMVAFAACNVDLFLSGHLHASSITHTVDRYKIAGHAALVIQAGTAISTRLRSEVNSWNLLRIAPPSRLSIERFAWAPDARSFQRVATADYRKSSNGWSIVTENTTDKPNDAPRQRSA